MGMTPTHHGEARRRRWLRAFIAFAAVLGSQDAPAHELDVPPKLRKTIATVTLRIAKAGRTEARELVDILRTLGEPAEDATTLGSKVDVAIQAAAKAKDRLPAEARTLRDAAVQLTELLPALEAADAKTLAVTILRIDPGVAEAHRAFGRTLTEGTWTTPSERARNERATQIQVALQGARKLPVGVSVGACQDAFALSILGPDANTARGHRATVHSTLAPEKLKRALREAVRATGVAQFILQDTLSIPGFTPSSFVVLTSQPEYERAINIARDTGFLTDKQAADAKLLSGWHLRNGTMLSLHLVESSLQALLFHRMLDTALWTGPGGYMINRLPPTLRAGFENWICLAYFGTNRRGGAWYDAGELAGRSVAPDEREKAERDARLRMADAGMPGARSWLDWLVRHGEDPLWAHTMLAHDGEISGDLLLKTTFVWEYLQLGGPRLRMVMDCELPPGKTSPGKQHTIIEGALGTTLDQLERDWEFWFAPERAGIVGRLDPEDNAQALTRDEQDTLAALAAIRSAALATLRTRPPDVIFDPDLSIGCRDHARYLALNPDQAASWPEAHEEWPDRDGFSTAGAWAASHAVIAPGSRNGPDAVTGWINTFYHRLPLLDPGLIRIGYGLRDDVAVLDASSLAGPVLGSWVVSWPHDGMKNVPTAFTPELPNPIPDGDQRTFGYCVTVQCSPDDWGAIDAIGNLRLFVGKPDGPEVEAWVSSPSAPTNPDLAPAGTWALIPKHRLKAKTRYHALFTRNNAEEVRFEFTTGS